MVERRLWQVGLFGALWFLLCAAMSSWQWLLTTDSADIIVPTVLILRFALAFVLSMALAFSVAEPIADVGGRRLRGGGMRSPAPAWVRVLAALFILAFVVLLGGVLFLAAQIAFALAFDPNPTLSLAFAATAALWYILFWALRRWRGRSTVYASAPASRAKRRLLGLVAVVLLVGAVVEVRSRVPEAGPLRVQASYTLPFSPSGLLPDPSSHALYMLRIDGNTAEAPPSVQVVVWDPATRQVRNTSANLAPKAAASDYQSGYALALDTVSRTAYVASGGYQQQAEVTALDSTTLAARQTRELDRDGGVDLFVDSGLHRVYAVLSGSILVLDGKTLATITSMGLDGAQQVALDPTHHRLYIERCQFDAGTVRVFDDVTLNAVGEAPTPGCNGRSAITVDPGLGAAYLWLQERGSFVVDGAADRIVKTASLADYVDAIATDPATHQVLVETGGSFHHLALFDAGAHQQLGQVDFSLDSRPTALALDPSRHLAYVCDIQGALITVSYSSSR